MNETLTNEEKRRIKGCVETIIDSAMAIKNELENTNSFKGYILEKVEPICWDSNCIKSIFKEWIKWQMHKDT